MTHLPGARMQEPDILPRHDMNQFARLDVPDLDKARLKRQDIWIIQRKVLRCALPLDLPVRPCTPAVAINKEAEVRVVEQEFPIQTFYVDWLHTLLARDEVERGIGLVEQRLPFSRFQGDDLEAASAAHTQRATQIMNRGGFSGNVKFLQLSAILRISGEGDLP